MKLNVLAKQLPEFLIDDPEFALCNPHERNRAEMYVEAMRSACTCNHRIGDAVAQFAQALGIPIKTGRRWWDRIARQGWKGALDTRKSQRAKSEIGKRLEFLAFWKSLIDQHNGSIRAAWFDLVTFYRAGNSINGYQDYSGRPPANARTGLPIGWTYENLLQWAPGKDERILAHQGQKAFRARVTALWTTRVGMQVGQCYQFDDVWHDNKVFYGAKLVRVVELGAIDVFSSRRVMWGLAPRIRDERDVEQALKERYMLNLTMSILMEMGYCKEGCTLIVEHRTAALSEKVEEGLYNASRGKIRVERSGIANKAAMLGWWAGEGGGNPRIKALLESLHGYYHNRLGLLPVQTGDNSRLNKPEILAAQDQYADKLAKEFEGLGPEATQAMLGLYRLPALTWHQFAGFLNSFYTVVDSRREHKLEGWDKAGLVKSQWRLSTGSSDWHDADELSVLADAQYNAVKGILDTNPGQLMRPMRCSPMEVWTAGQRSLARLPRWLMHQVLGDDNGRELSIRVGRFDFEDAEIDPDGLRYAGMVEDPEGHRIMLKEGETYLCYCNPISAGTLNVYEASGRYLGAALRIERAPRVDREAMRNAIEQDAMRQNAQMVQWRARNSGEATGHQDLLQHNALITRVSRALRSGEIKDDTALVATESGAMLTDGDRAAALDQAHTVEMDPQFTPEFITDVFKRDDADEAAAE